MVKLVKLNVFSDLNCIRTLTNYIHSLKAQTAATTRTSFVTELNEN